VTTDKPVSAKTIEFGNVLGGVTYLNELTGWNGSTLGPLPLKQTLTTFGAGLCGEYDLCTTKDPACAASPTCQKDLKKCLQKKTCKEQRKLYVIHLVDWKANAAGVISLDQSRWALYQSDSDGKYHPINADDGSFPSIWDVDNGILISISRLLIARDGNNNLIAAHANLAPPLIEYTITNTEKKPLWLAGLETLISGLTGPSFDPQALSTGTPSPYLTRIRIMALSSKKLNRPFDVAIAANATGSGPGEGECGNLTLLSKCTFSNTFSVVARDYIAFGVNIVPHGPAEATYTAGSTTPSITNHNELYGVVDFTLFPKTCPMTKCIYAQAGLPFSGAATHLPYVGAAYPIPIPWLRDHFSLSAFAGAVFMEQQGPGPKRDRATKLLWGFEVPIASFTGAIKQAKW
jgi:hypothetical protein